MILLIGATIPISYFAFSPLANIQRVFVNLKKLSKGDASVFIPNTSTAAEKASELCEEYNYSLLHLKIVALLIGAYCSAGLFYRFLAKKTNQLLFAYKRFKGASKIKKHIEDFMSLMLEELA